MDAGDPLEAPDAWLSSPAAMVARASAAELLLSCSGLEAATAFARAHPQIPAGHRSAVLSAAALDLAARDKGYPPGLLWTRTGQEQSTGPLPAARRARLLRAAGIGSVVDLTAGLGMDARSMLEAGISVTAVESDPVTARYLEFNLSAVSPDDASAPAWHVIHGDSTDPVVLQELGDTSEAFFVDPARRSASHDGSRSRPERDPELWSPPWSFVEKLLPARVAAKVAPGFLPGAHWHAEWVSIERTVVECALYSWPVIDATRQAAVWRDGWHIVAATTHGDAPEQRGIDALLLEVDPAVIRSGGLASLAREIPGAHIIDPLSTWLTAPDIEHSARMNALVRAYRVVDEVPTAPRKLRVALRGLGITAAALKTGDVRIDAARLRTELRIADDDARAVVFTNSGSGARAFLVDRIR